MKNFVLVFAIACLLSFVNVTSGQTDQKSSNPGKTGDADTGKFVPTHEWQTIPEGIVMCCWCNQCVQ